MDAFLENPLFLFVEDAEPILPIFRNFPERNESGRVVELADVGCDTETSYPIHFSRGAFDRRHREAENFESVRRYTKRYNERFKNCSTHIATARNNLTSRNDDYARRKAQQNGRVYNDVYIAELDCDSFAEDSFDDLEPSKNNSNAKYKHNYYTEYLNPRNIIGHFGRETLIQNTRYNYLRNLESREYDERACEREDIHFHWFADNDKRNVHGTRVIDARSKQSASNNFGKRANIHLRIPKNFNRNAKFGRGRNGVVPKQEREQEDIFCNTAANSRALSQNDFRNFVSSENEPNHKESTFSKPSRITNRNHLRETTSQRRRSYNLDSWLMHMDIADTEKANNTETREQRNQEESSSIESAGYPIPKNKDDESYRSNLFNPISSRVRSARVFVDDRLSDNIQPTEEVSASPRLVTEHRKININYPMSTEKREKTMNSSRARTDVRRFPDKFDDTTAKSFNKPSGFTGQSTKIFERIADFESNRKMRAAEENNNVNLHIENSAKNIKIDQIDRIGLPRSVFKEAMRNKKTFASRVVLRTDTNKQKKRKFSRLPIRTWKRMRTREPAALRFTSDANNETLNRSLQEKSVAHASERPNNHPERMKNDEILCKKIAEDNVIEDRDNVKQNDRRGAGSLGTNKSRLISAKLKDSKDHRTGSNMAERTREQHRR